jgi:hypothetical protein
MGMVRAHIDLARAEFSEILDQIKQVAILAGIALGCGLLVLLLIPLGLLLFLGEWLFGSIGWGVLLGSEALLALTVTLLAAAIGVGARRLLGDFIVALVVSIVVAVVLGANVTNQAWTQLGDRIAGNVAVEWRVLVVAAGSSAIVLGVLLALLGGARGGVGGFIAGLIVGTLVGAAVGATTAITFSWEVAAAFGVLVGFVVWPVLDGLAILRQGIDPDAFKKRFWPEQTIETTKETIEWVREQTPLGRKP